MFPGITWLSKRDEDIEKTAPGYRAGGGLFTLVCSLRDDTDGIFPTDRSTIKGYTG